MIVKLLRSNRGFTLLELLIVIALISILVVAAAVSYSESQKRARDTLRRSDLQKIALALEEYYQDHKEYPPTNSNPQTACTYSTGDSACCLLGGSIAANVNAGATCDLPRNTYIGDGNFNAFPRDPRNNQSYIYISNGQSYVLVAKNYEGKVPSGNVYSSTEPYWASVTGWDPAANGKYFINDPNN